MTDSDWLSIDETAALIGKSVSTVRRAVPTMPAGTVRRKGAKIYIALAYIEKRWNVTRGHETTHGALNDLRQYIASLEADNAAKTQIIQHLTETNSQLSAFNARLLLERNPDHAGTQAPSGPDWYLILTLVVIGIGLCIVVYLVAG